MDTYASTAVGKLIFQLLGSLAEFEHSNISDRTTSGRDRVAQNGAWIGGPIPYGYVTDEQGKLLPSTFIIPQLNCTEAELIQDLFQRIAQGSTILAECQCLNELHISPAIRYRKGKLSPSQSNSWRPSRVSQLLHNSVYIGEHVYKSKNNPIIRNIPALIDIQTWHKVHAQLKQNYKIPPGHTKHINLLRGLIICELCGNHFVGQPSYSLRKIKVEFTSAIIIGVQGNSLDIRSLQKKTGVLQSILKQIGWKILFGNIAKKFF